MRLSAPREAGPQRLPASTDGRGAVSTDWSGDSSLGLRPSTWSSRTRAGRPRAPPSRCGSDDRRLSMTFGTSRSALDRAGRGCRPHEPRSRSATCRPTDRQQVAGSSRAGFPLPGRFAPPGPDAARQGRQERGVQPHDPDGDEADRKPAPAPLERRDDSGREHEEREQRPRDEKRAGLDGKAAAVCEREHRHVR